MYKDNLDDKLPGHEDALELVKQYENMCANNESRFFEHEGLEDIIEYYEENARWEEAYKVAVFALEQHPYSANFLTKKAQFLHEKKQHTEALALIEQALLLSPTDLDALILQADIYNQLGNYLKALEILKAARIFADREDKSDIYIAASDVYENWGKMTKSYTCAKKALQLFPDSEMAQIRYDYIAVETERFKESIKIQNKLIAANPYAYLAWYHLGNAYFGMERYRKAIDAYEYAIAINDKFIPACRDSAEAWFELGNYARAKQLYLESLELGEKDDELLYSIGLCDMYLQNFLSAIDYFTQAVALNPFHADAYYQLGECLKLNGNNEEALVQYNKALSIEPKNDNYLFAAAEIHLLTENYDLAQHLYFEALDVNNEEPAYWVRAAAIYFYTDLYTEGVELLEMAIAKFPHRADIYYLLSACLITTGKKQRGYVYFTRALQLDAKGVQYFFELLPQLKSNPDIQMLIELSRLT